MRLPPVQARGYLGCVKFEEPLIKECSAIPLPGTGDFGVERLVRKSGFDYAANGMENGDDDKSV